jgi:hypothetical protein
MLPAIKQRDVQNEIMDLCGWVTVRTFIQKKFGRVPIRPPEKEIIERIFERFNLNAWTGEYIRKGQL